MKLRSLPPPEPSYTICLTNKQKLEVRASSHFGTELSYCFSTLPPTDLERASISGKPLEVVFEIDRQQVLYVEKTGALKGGRRKTKT